MVTLAMMFGDGYSNDIVQPFVDYLEAHGIHTIGIPLLEEEDSTSYKDITPENYCKYIDKYIPRFCNDLYLYGISKGCEWLTIYASRRQNVKKLILVEPTTFPGKSEYLVEFEKDRGNDYVGKVFASQVLSGTLPTKASLWYYSANYTNNPLSFTINLEVNATLIRTT